MQIAKWYRDAWEEPVVSSGSCALNEKQTVKSKEQRRRKGFL